MGHLEYRDTSNNYSYDIGGYWLPVRETFAGRRYYAWTTLIDFLSYKPQNWRNSSMDEGINCNVKHGLFWL